MNLYQVIMERDGLTCKAPGVTETEVMNVTRWFVAKNIETVWAATERLRNDSDEGRFLGIHEVAHGVQVLLPKETELDAGAGGAK